MQDVTPHRRQVSREVPNVSDPSLKLGLEYLRARRTDQALDLFTRVGDQADDPEVAAAAYYLGGIALESEMRYDAAFESYATANSLAPANPMYIEVLTAVEQPKREVGDAVSQRGR